MRRSHARLGSGELDELEEELDDVDEEDDVEEEDAGQKSMQAPLQHTGPAGGQSGAVMYWFTQS
jgi:hypothetical protein